MLVVLTLATFGVLTPVASAQSVVTCDVVVRVSIELEGDLVCDASEDGIIVGAPGITIDLGGHSIRGAGDGVGVRVDRFDGVVVTDGIISNFDRGVRVQGARDVTVEDLVLDSNDEADIFLDNIAGAIVDGNEISAVGIGIAAGRTLDALIEDNEISGGDVAIAVGGHRTTIEDNELVDGGAGVVVEGDENTIEDNELERGDDNGIVVLGDGNAVLDNDVVAYRSGIWIQADGELGAGNLVEDNEIEASDGDGIHVDGRRTVIADNEVEGNGDDGIEVDGPAPNIVSNEARDNADWGIDADVLGVTGGRNDAVGNGSACRPRALCD